MSADSLAFQILSLLETPGIGTARVNRLLELWRQKDLSPQQLTHQAFLESCLTPGLATAVRDKADTVRRTWDGLREKDVRSIPVFDPLYPASVRTLLGPQAPPLLFATGNTALLEKVSVAFCGSRKASEKGMMVAADCAAELAAHGFNVVSGYASGVDMHAHRGALEAGGTTTLVLAEGMLQFRLKREIKDVWDRERTLVVSEFLPGLPWNVHSAMQRNRTICALSRALVLIEARTNGGSMAAGRECLRLGLPLFAAVYEGMPESAEGNRELLQQGARPLRKSRASNRANIRPILAAIEIAPLALRASGRGTAGTRGAFLWPAGR
jgi:DNA processing protein